MEKAVPRVKLRYFKHWRFKIYLNLCSVVTARWTLADKVWTNCYISKRSSRYA